MNRSLLPAVVAALVVAAGAAAAADQFDLVCGGAKKSGAPWTRTVSVDLARHSWCQRAGGGWTDCTTQHPIQAVEPGRIVFYDGSGLGGDGLIFTVDRSDGSVEQNGEGEDVKGTCHAAPFTPMPANRF